MMASKQQRQQQQRQQQQNNTDACELVLDADEIFTALDEGIPGLDPLAAERHVERCESCRAYVKLRSKARRAWTSSLRWEAPARASSVEEQERTLSGAMGRSTSFWLEEEEDRNLRRLWEKRGA